MTNKRAFYPGSKSVIDVTPFRRSAPEAQGIPSRAIQAFLDAAEREIRDLHSIILLSGGTLVAEGYWEPYGPSYPHTLFSLSKSFTSTAIGLLVAEGRLSIDDRVLSFFPTEAPPKPSDNLLAMRVRDLLTMTTGHDTEPARSPTELAGRTWVGGFLAHPVEHVPGTHFLYNSLATYVLSAVAQLIAGERLIHYLQPRLFAPLGIEHPTWETSPQGIDVGGWGLSITTADIARFGQLYLQRGIWRRERLLPESWVAEATSRQVPNGPNGNPDWAQGYGYQFWRCRHGAYRGDGAFGQFCVVLPEQDAVLAITSGVSNMQAVLDLVWERLLPVLGCDSLPDDRPAQEALAARCARLGLAPAAGRSSSSRAATVSGREFTLDENPSGIATLRFDFAEGGGAVTIRDGLSEHTVPLGSGRWVRSEGVIPAREFPLTSEPPGKVAASGTWVDDQTYVVELIWYETPFRRRLTCRFEDDRLVVDQTMNVSFGPTVLPRLEGRATKGEQ